MPLTNLKVDNVELNKTHLDIKAIFCCSLWTKCCKTIKNPEEMKRVHLISNVFCILIS